MIVLYTITGCSSCKKIKKYLKENNIDFLEINILKELLSNNDASFLVRYLKIDYDYSFDERYIKTVNCLNDDELLSYLRNNPSVIKKPLLFEENNFCVDNINKDIIKLRNKIICDKECVNYICCGH